MKYNISKRLIFTNLSILFVALLSFFVITAVYFNLQLRENVNTQLKIEHISMLKQFTFQQDYNKVLAVQEQTDLEQATHIFCSDTGDTRDFEVLYTSRKMENLIAKDEDFVVKIANIPQNTPITLTVGNEKYTVIVTSYKTFMNENAIAVGKTDWDMRGNEDIVLVSLTSLQGVRTMMYRNILIFVIVLLFITLLSYFLIKNQSKKITVPLEQLSKVADEYANRNFENKLMIETGDEIERLSNSISKMVEGLTSYEKSQIALFRNLSHELKTPLAAVSGYADAILDGYYKENTAPLKVISEESMRIKTILDDLIFLSKMDSSIEEFHLESHDIVPILTLSIEKIESIAILNDIDIDYIPCSPIMVTCDESKMIRMFINILSNALKHAKECIKIEIIPHEDFTVIEFSDDGNGFDEVTLEKLFKNEMGETLTGSGLGLTIVGEIATHHGFRVTAENTDMGAKVTVKIK